MIIGKKIATLAFISLSSSTFSFAAPIKCDRFIPNDRASAELNKDYANLLLTPNAKRTLVQLDADEKIALGYNPTDLLLANYAKGENHYVVYFPGIQVNGKNADDSLKFHSINPLPGAPIIKDIKFVKERWAYGTRPLTSSLEVHALLLVEFTSKFQPRIVLNQEECKKYTGKLEEISKLIISTEAVRTVGNEDANFITGAIGGEFAVATLVYDYEKRKAATKDEGGDYEEVSTDLTRIFPLKPTAVSEATKSPNLAIFLGGVNDSLVKKRSGAYNLFNNNCTTALFSLFERTLDMGTRNNKEINASIVKFVKENLKDIAKAGVALAQSSTNGNASADAILKTFPDLAKVLSILEIAPSALTYDPSSAKWKQMITAIEQRTFTTEEITFLSGWPPFVEGNLRAMNLLKSARRMR